MTFPIALHKKPAPKKRVSVSGKTKPTFLVAFRIVESEYRAMEIARKLAGETRSQFIVNAVGYRIDGE